LLWLDWRPEDDLRVQYSIHTQGVGVYRSSVDVGGEVTELDEPNWTDNRVKVTVKPAKLSFVRAELRHRSRHDRGELRYGLAMHFADIATAGPYLEGRAYYDDIATGNNGWVGADRLYYRAAAGWEKGPVDVAAGVSFVERDFGPVSNRSAGATTEIATSDLSPFVMEAQNIAFVRGFVVGRHYFAGLDVEANLGDSGELRVLLQAGALVDALWGEQKSTLLEAQQ